MDQQSNRDQYQLKGWAGLFCLIGALAVILGAFGAHGLEGKIESQSLESYQTGILYHFIHTLAGLILILTSKQSSDRWLLISCWSFLLGIILFSGSIYFLSIQSLLELELEFLGPVTPVGGLFFILAWVAAGIHYFKTR